MLSLEQVRLLEQRVQRVIKRLGELQSENSTLREELAGYQQKVEELEKRVEAAASGQAEIEQTILNALHHLDEVEDAVGGDGAERRMVEAQATTGEAPAATDVPADSHEPEPTLPAGDESAVADTVPHETASEPQEEVEITISDDDHDEQAVDAPEEEDNGPELDIF